MMDEESDKKSSEGSNSANSAGTADVHRAGCSCCCVFPGPSLFEMAEKRKALREASKLSNKK